MDRMLSRRLAVGLPATAIFAAAMPDVHAAMNQDAVDQSLRDLAERKGFLLGGLVNPDRVLANIGPTAQTGFNTALLDGPLHWQHLYNQSGGGPDFTSVNTVVEYALASGMAMEAHHLNRGGFHRIDRSVSALPEWVRERVATDGGDPIPLLRENITAILSHFAQVQPDLVRTCTVVNEAVNHLGGAGDFEIYLPDGSVTIGRNFWNQASLEYYGDPWFYVAESFRITAQVRDTLGVASSLIINEHGAEQPDTSKGEGYLALLNTLVSLQVPIDGVGFQMHLRPGEQYQNGLTLQNEDEINSFAAEFQRHISRFPVPPYITEMEVDQRFWRDLGYSTAESRRLVGVTVRRILEAFIAGGGKSLMFYDHTNITGGSTLPDDDPNSPIQQMIEVLDQLPDAGTV